MRSARGTANARPLQRGLSILKESGEYREIYRKWLGVLEPPRLPWSRIIRYGALAVAPLLLVLGGTVIWNRTLKKEVALRTAALENEVAERQLAMDELRVRQRQLIQADKMTSLGILVSGVAHEVNNPTGLILLNLPHLQKAWEDAEPVLEEHYRQVGDFRLGWLQYSRMCEEIPQMLAEMQEGARRIKRIVEEISRILPAATTPTFPSPSTSTPWSPPPCAWWTIRSARRPATSRSNTPPTCPASAATISASSRWWSTWCSTPVRRFPTANAESLCAPGTTPGSRPCSWRCMTKARGLPRSNCHT
jgi:hypothetical protein